MTRDDQLQPLQPAAATRGKVLRPGLSLPPHEAGLLAASAAVSGPASAALRLLGLDPLGVTRVQAELAGAIDRVARAARCPGTGGERLPASAAPMLDLLAERHAARPVRLFAS